MTAINFVVIRKLLDQVFGPSSKFNVGDSVEVLEGGPLMVVVEIVISREAKEPLIRCQWFDNKTNGTMKALFREREIKMIDWYRR